MKFVLYRIYQFTLMWPLMLVVTVLAAIVTIIGCLCGGGRWWGYYPEIPWSRLMCWLALVRVTVTREGDIDPKTSYVFVCNHQGAYDIFSVYGWLGHNFRWMMKQSLRKIPLIGFACAISKQVFVDHSTPSATRRTIENAERLLRGGMSIVVFPEGRRCFNGRMGAFKRGAYSLATEFNMPVVPVSIDGSFNVLPRTRKLPRWGHIHLTIHKPVTPPEQGYDLPELMELTRSMIASALPQESED